MKRAFRTQSNSRNRLREVHRSFVIPRLNRIGRQRVADTIQRLSKQDTFRHRSTSLTRRWMLPHRPIQINSELASFEDRQETWSLVTIPLTAMSKNYGSGGTATLQRSKLSLKQKVRQVDPKTDDSGGGGNIGKIIHNGGGGGGDDDDDDDYFFDDGGEDGDGDGDKFFGKVLPQLYDKISITAVLSEWYRTVSDMPSTLRRAIEMGLFSSAQLVRFLSMDIRPNATRTLQRSLPGALSRGFVGRIMADPAFYHKLIIENVLAMSGCLYYEMKIRGDRWRKEWDLVLLNTLGVMASTTSVVWLVTPSRSFGGLSKLPWQTLTSSLPNNIFDASGPLREYTNQGRIVSLFTKSMELAFVGALAGVWTTGVSNLAVSLHRRVDPDFEPSYESPSFTRSVIGLSLFYGLHAHTRYQLLSGIDRYFFDHSNYLWSYLTTSGICRLVNSCIAEAHRPMFTGLPIKASEKSEVLVVSKSKVQRRRQVSGSPLGSDQGPPKKPRVKKTKGFELSMTR